MNEAEMALRLQFSVTCKALTCPREKKNYFFFEI